MGTLITRSIINDSGSITRVNTLLAVFNTVLYLLEARSLIEARGSFIWTKIYLKIKLTDIKNKTIRKGPCLGFF